MQAWKLKDPWFCLLLLLALAFPSGVLWAAEDTAHLTFQKPVVSKNRSYLYTVQKGDALSKIISARLGPVSPEERRKIYKTIKALNPRLADFDRIYAGQRLRLPGRDTASGGRNIRISALQVSSGGVPVESAVIGKTPVQSPEKSHLPVGYRLAFIREVIQRMNGTITTSGNYYIPLPQTGQVTVDCSRIPVVELPDGISVLIDFTERVPVPFKSMIQSHWPSYRFVTANGQDDPLQILQKVINASQAFTMARSEKPLTFGDIPHIEIFVDWVVAEKAAAGKTPYRQGIAVIRDGSQVLPKHLKEYASRKGVTVTEYLEGTGIVESTAPEAAMPEITVMSGETAIDFCSALLRFLEYEPAKDVDLRIFNRNRDGFNVAVKADLLVKKDNSRITFHSREIPPPFAKILTENSIEAVTFKDGESKQEIIEKTLAAMKVPFSKGIFLYPETGQGGNQRVTVSFPSIRMARDRSYFHFIDFSMDQQLYQMLSNKWAVELIRY